MKKKTSFSTQGQRADIGELEIFRKLPNRYADAVGPFVFFDHIVPKLHPHHNEAGTGAHPHRGIATLTYVLSGEAEHFDSADNHAIVHSGGVQWMNAGKGIVHDEVLNRDSLGHNGIVHALQFWINLPSAIKAEPPAYAAIEGTDVPRKWLPDAESWLKVIVGSFDDLTAAIPTYGEQFLYHVHLAAGAHTVIDIADKLEVAAFLPNRRV